MVFKTENKLRKDAVASNDDQKLLEYEVLRDAIGKKRYKWFFSPSTITPLVDPIDAERCCEKIFSRIASTLYGRRKPEIPFVSFIERGNQTFRGQPKYHIHLLVGDATNTHIRVDEFPFNLRKAPDKLVRKMCVKIRYGTNGRGQFTFPIHQTVIANQAPLIDYLLKGVRDSSYRICYHASNIDFGKSAIAS
jgi:hypothetical protein